MFYNRFCIFHDGEFVAGYNDFDEAMDFYADTLTDYVDAGGNMEDHEWQMIEVIRGLK